MSGYLGRPAETAAVLRDGWLATGDLGFLRGGDLFLVGRAKDVVIVRGRNHAAEEIEAAAGAVAGLRPGGVAALGWLPESGEEEELLLLVEREPGGNGKGQPGAAEALAAACREAVLGALGLRAGRVAVLDAGALPRTSSGKLRRREALRRWLAGELVEVAPTTLEGSPAAARGRA
jgi:acyl-CoA synthetase (AMP-forming)/AMP-acid ligase II